MMEENDYVQSIRDTGGGRIPRCRDTRLARFPGLPVPGRGLCRELVESYPALTLEQVHGALAYYLANQREVDAYLARSDAAAESQHQESRRTNAELIAKLQRVRHANQIPG